jgi:ABC-type antimicrobial peptide transport system permease subunit
LQSREFLLLVGLSCLLAIPVAWSVLSQWLQQFQYRTAVSWWIFAVGGGSALVIALVTVSWQAVRAARMNPVRSLRAE